MGTEYQKNAKEVDLRAAMAATTKEYEEEWASGSNRSTPVARLRCVAVYGPLVGDFLFDLLRIYEHSGADPREGEEEGPAEWIKFKASEFQQHAAYREMDQARAFSVLQTIGLLDYARLGDDVWAYSIYPSDVWGVV
jgi:hypothetical protein